MNFPSQTTAPAFLSLILVHCLASFSSSGGEVEPVLEQRARLDRSVWESEVVAQEYETAFIELWDDMRAGDPIAALIAFPFESLRLPRLALERALIEDVSVFRPSAAPLQTFTHQEFATMLARYRDAGYEIEQSDWHHAAFDDAENGPKRSTFTFGIHVKGPKPEHQRFIIRGALDVVWQEGKSDGVFKPKNIEASKLEILTRAAPPAFEGRLWLQSKPQTTPYSIVLVEDLNGDGLPDIAFPRRNKLYLNKGDFEFEETILAKFMIRGLATAALLADLNNDGVLEYVVSTYDAPFLFAYSYNTRTNAFDGKPFGIWKAEAPLKAQLLAAGDITGDGLPELYVGQSTPAYENGKVPSPYFDANDGPPAFVLRNTGGFLFKDMTESTSVASKRGRRAYVASFQDLDGDLQNDLLVNSDFSGIDVHQNQGGTLVNATERTIDDRSLFGMSHAFADFDRDGHIDLMAVGMSSTTARRLEQMGLGRDEFPEHQAMRMRIAKGNRLYYGNGEGAFAQRPVSEGVARSGWSWGSSSLDFNNDSYPDIFVANGYLSKTTARDYCSTFWTHDIYSESAFSSEQLGAFYDQFGPKALVGGGKMGWNPFENDHLYLNLAGEEFVNVAYLFGVSNGGDGRAVIGADFDRDGRSDLLLVEQDSLNGLERVHLYRNRLETAGNWIGIDLKANADTPLMGAIVELHCPDFTTRRVFTTGESFSGQHPATLHFGLSGIETVNRVRIIWPNGKESELDHPDINRYHPAPLPN